MASSAYQAIFPGVNQGKDVYFQGSRQMDNFSRCYYERELGAGIAPSPSMREHFGYTEPFRRFVQREDFSPQANPLRNQMPGWLPGADYLTNFHVGDPFIKTRSFRPAEPRTSHAPARARLSRTHWLLERRTPGSVLRIALSQSRASRAPLVGTLARWLWF